MSCHQQHASLPRDVWFLRNASKAQISLQVSQEQSLKKNLQRRIVTTGAEFARWPAGCQCCLSDKKLQEFAGELKK